MERLKEYSYTRLQEMINNVRMSLRLHIQKHNKPYCHEAEGFIQAVMAYSPLVRPEKVKEFELVLRRYVYGCVALPETFDEKDLWNTTVERAEEMNTLAVVNSIYQLIDYCNVVKKWDDTQSWEEIDKVLHKQGHSGYSFSGLANMMIRYSDIGVEFVDKYCPDRLERDSDFAEIYNNAKTTLKSKQNENVVRI